MKSNYANGFLGAGLGERKKGNGFKGAQQDFLRPVANKKAEERYSPELEEFFKTGNQSVLAHSVSQSILKDRIAQDKKDNEGINSWQGKGFYESKPVVTKNVKKWGETPEYKEDRSWEGESWEKKEKKKTEENLFKSTYEPRDKAVEYEKKSEYKAPKIEDFKGINGGQDSAGGSHKDTLRDQFSYKKDPVPRETSLSQWAWDELEGFEKERTGAEAKKQMAKKNGEEEWLGRTNVKTPSPYEGYIENKGKMGYNGDDSFNQKRNPQDYVQEIEKFNEMAMERARKKYDYDNIAIHTGEDPSSQIDKEDGKVHVWIDPNNMQEIERKNKPAKIVSDPNIKIYDSRRIDNRQEQEAILERVLNSEEFQQYKDLYPRDMNSYKKEWVAHNIAGEFADISDSKEWQDRTKDVDLNYIDKNGFAYDFDMFKRYIKERGNNGDK